MNLSRWGIQYPLPSLMLFVVLTIAGFWGWRQLPISQLPDIALPSVQVSVGLTGATPTQIETDITRKIEDSVSSIADINRMTSAISEGSSITRIEFELGRDMDEALDEVRDAVTRIRRELPADIDEPLVQRLSLVGGTVLAPYRRPNSIVERGAHQCPRVARDEFASPHRVPHRAPHPYRAQAQTRFA